MKRLLLISSCLLFFTSLILFIAGCCSEKALKTTREEKLPLEIHDFYCDKSAYPGDAIYLTFTTTKIGSLQAKAFFHKIGKDKILSSGELYFVKSKLIKTINEKLRAENTEIKDIIFNYKKWDENNDKE